MELTPLEKLSKITGLNVQNYLERFIFFLDSDYYKQVYTYYSGATKEPNAQAFDYLASLESQCKAILEKCAQSKNRIDRVGDIELFMQIEESNMKLKTIRNLSFLLSTNAGSQNGVLYPYILGKNETLQDVSFDVLDRQDINDWFNIAIANKVNEVSYRIGGGLTINLVATPTLTVGSLQSVLGSQIGDEALGNDIQRKLTFENNNLKILNNRETFLQSVDICINLQKGDVPYNPNLGVSPEAIVGTNLNTVNIAVVLRELFTTFSQDDTIASFEISEVSIIQDMVRATLQVTAVTGEAQDFALTIQ